MYVSYKGDKWVPGVIMEKKGPVTYMVKMGDKICKRHADQITSKEIDDYFPMESTGDTEDTAVQPTVEAQEDQEQDPEDCPAGN